MKKVVLTLTLSMSILGWSQIGIGTNKPDFSAALEVHSESDKKGGVLPPRVDIQSPHDKETIKNPATGLLVYKPSSSGEMEEGLYINQGTASTPDWILTSNNSLDYLTRITTAISDNDMIMYEKGNSNFPVSRWKFMKFKNRDGKISDVLTLPKDGIYMVPIAPFISIQNDNTVAPELSGDAATFQVDFRIYKNGVIDNYQAPVVAVTYDSNNTSVMNTSFPMGYLYMDGKKGDKFTIDFGIAQLYDLNKIIKSIKFIGGDNEFGGMTSLTIVELITDTNKNIQ